MHIRILPIFLLSLTILVSCGTHKVYNRVYLARPMPNVESPFTKNCSMLGVAYNQNEPPLEYLDKNSDSDILSADGSMKEVTITAICLNDKKAEVGRSTLKVSALNIHIGSGEGSSYTEEFAKKAITSGKFFPLIQEIND